MKNIRMAILAALLAAGSSTVAFAQRGCPQALPGPANAGGGGGGGGGGRGGGRGAAPVSCYQELFGNIRISQQVQLKIDSIGTVYHDSIIVYVPQGGGPGGGGGAGGPGGGPTPFTSLPDSVQKKALSLVEARNKAIESLLNSDQKKLFESNVVTETKLRGVTQPGGGL